MQRIEHMHIVHHPKASSVLFQNSPRIFSNVTYHSCHQEAREVTAASFTSKHSPPPLYVGASIKHGTSQQHCPCIENSTPEQVTASVVKHNQSERATHSKKWKQRSPYNIYFVLIHVGPSRLYAEVSLPQWPCPRAAPL